MGCCGSSTFQRPQVSTILDYYLIPNPIPALAAGQDGAWCLCHSSSIISAFSLGDPLTFVALCGHVPDWQPCILLGMAEARSLNVKNTHTQCCGVCVNWAWLLILLVASGQLNKENYFLGLARRVRLSRPTSVRSLSAPNLNPVLTAHTRTPLQYFHAHFIPIAGVENEMRTLIGSW